jgi:hypothetical protein
MGNCQLCGRPSSIYSLCVKCDERKKQGQLRRCDECGNWSEGSSSFCPTCKWKFQERKDAMDETKGYIGRSDTQKAPEKPVEKTSGFGKGKYLSMAAKTLTTGMEKTKEFTKDTYGAVKEKMPSFKGQQDAARASEETPNPELNNFRDKHPKQYRTQDGHFVRSAYEQALDDWFYSKQIVHEYERSLTPPSGDWMCPDFYLPYDRTGKFLGNLPGGIYVEFWGLEEKEEYKVLMEHKQELYTKEKLFLIDLYPKDMTDPSTELPKIFGPYFGDKIK